jgi:hypothetical protein
MSALPHLARLPGPAAGIALLQAIDSPDFELSHQALAYALGRPDIPDRDLWRAALRAARRGSPETCRERLAERLQTKPRETLLALEALRGDPDVGAAAYGLLSQALGPSHPSTESLSADRLREISFWAKAKRLPTHLPDIEDEASVLRSREEHEMVAFERLQIGSAVIRNPVDPGRLYVAVALDYSPEEVLLARIQDPLGRERWLLADGGHVGPRDYCEPLPGQCRFPSWLPEGRYLTFSDGSNVPVLSGPGPHTVTIESSTGKVRFGPITVR